MKNKRFFISLVFHIRKSHTIVFTIGDDGSRQYSSVAAKILRGFSVKSKFTYCFIRSENFSLEKQTVFHFSLLSHKEITHNCFHYWRRREPPVCLRCGENSSRVFSKVKIYLLFYKKRKLFTGKTNDLYHAFVSTLRARSRPLMILILYRLHFKIISPRLHLLVDIIFFQFIV